MLGGKSPALPIGQTLQSLAASTLKLNRAAVESRPHTTRPNQSPLGWVLFQRPEELQTGPCASGSIRGTSFGRQLKASNSTSTVVPPLDKGRINAL